MKRILFALPLLALAAAAPVSDMMQMPEAEFAMATPHYRLRSDAVAAGLQPAPMPDVSTSLPASIEGDGSSLAPRVYHQNEQFQGNGFSSGSTVQGSQQHGSHPAFGIGLNVPVQ